MTPQECPYTVGQKVQLIGPDGREDARALSIHRTGRGIEIVVRTTDQGGAAGRNVNVFTTSGRSGQLVAITDPAAARATS